MTQTLQETQELIDQTARETKSHSARLAMAKLASGPLSKLSDAGKSLWSEYLAKGAPAA